MERIFMTGVVWMSLAFADASALLAAEAKTDVEVHVLSAALVVDSKIDPIVTGPVIPVSASEKGVLRLLDGCDADCQAQRLGLVFAD